MEIALPTSQGESYRRYIRQLGVTGALHFALEPDPGESVLNYLDLMNLRTSYQDAGINLFSLENLGFQSNYYDPIILGWHDDRDQQIENIAENIRVMGKAGIRFFGYHWMVAHKPLANPVFCTSKTTRGRGDATVRSFDLELARNTPLFRDREYTPDEIWANYEYFMKAILPVAEEAGVTISLHPDDPPVSSIGGIPRLFGTFESFKRAMEIADSPNWGLTFCLGNWALMGPGVAEEALRYFGERGKICYVHFQAVQGRPERFQECFFEEGQLDFLKALRILKEVGFDGYILPSHGAALEGDPAGSSGVLNATLCVGYLQALLRVLASE